MKTTIVRMLKVLAAICVLWTILGLVLYRVFLLIPPHERITRLCDRGFLK